MRVFTPFQYHVFTICSRISAFTGKIKRSSCTYGSPRTAIMFEFAKAFFLCIEVLIKWDKAGFKILHILLPGRSRHSSFEISKLGFLCIAFNQMSSYLRTKINSVQDTSQTGCMQPQFDERLLLTISENSQLIFPNARSCKYRFILESSWFRNEFASRIRHGVYTFSCASAFCLNWLELCCKSNVYLLVTCWH